APVTMVALDADVVVLDHLGDLERPVGDERRGRGRPLVAALGDDVFADRTRRGHRRKPQERRVGTGELDLESEVVDRLETERAEGAVDARLVPLRIHQRYLLAVEHRAGEQRLVGRRETG